MDNSLHPPLQPQLTIFFPYNNIHMMSIFPSFFHILLSLWSLASCVCVPSRSVMSDSLRPDGPWPVRFLCPRDFPGKNTGVGCHFLLQGTEPGSSAVGQMATHTALKVNKFYLYIQLLKFLNIQPTWFIQAGYHWPVIIKCRLSNKSFFNKNNLTRRMLCNENVCCSLSVFIIATELDFMWEILRYHTFFSPYI